MSHPTLPANLHKYELYQDKQISNSEEIGKIYFGKNLATQRQVIIQVIEKNNSLTPKKIIEKGALMLDAIQQSIALLEFNQYAESNKNSFLIYEFQQNKIGNFILGYYQWDIISVNQGFIFTAEEQEKKKKCLCYQVRRNKFSEFNQYIDIMSKEFNERLIELNSLKFSKPFLIKVYQAIKTNMNYYAIFEYCERNLDEQLNEQTSVDLSKNLEIFIDLINAFDELRACKEYQQEILTLKHIFFNGEQVKLFPDIYEISSYFQVQSFLEKNQNYLHFFEDLFNYVPPELGSLSQKELESKNIASIVESSISKFQAWNFGVILYKLLFNIFPFKLSQTQLSNNINQNTMNKVFAKSYYEVNVPIIAQMPEPQQTLLTNIVKDCLQLSPKKRITFEALKNEINKIFGSVDFNSLSEQLSSLDLKLGSIATKQIKEQFTNDTANINALQNLIQLEITEHSKDTSNDSTLISQVMNNIDQHLKNQTLKSQKFGENQKAQEALKSIPMDAIGEQEVSQLKKELKSAISRIKLRKKPESMYSQSKPFPVIFEQCESNFVIEFKNQETNDCETSEFDYEMLQPYEHQIHISQFIQDTILALSKSALYVPNAFTQYTLVRLNKLRLTLLKQDLEAQSNKMLEHSKPKEFYQSDEYKFAVQNLEQCLSQFQQTEEKYKKELEASGGEQKIYEENILNVVLKAPWKSYDDIKLILRKILYNNYYYLENFMNSHSFQKVNSLIISVIDFKRIQLRLLCCMSLDKVFPLYQNKEFFSFDSFNDMLRNYTENQLTSRMKGIMDSLFPNAQMGNQ